MGKERVIYPDFVDWAEHFIILPTTKKPVCFEDFQKRILRHVFKFDENGKLPYQVIVYSCPKKSGKTAINAIVMTYWAFNIESPNEIVIAANKFEQSLRPFREMRRFIDYNPILNGERIGDATNLVTLRNGTTILAIPKDVAGEAGSNHGLTTWDELWGYSSERDIRFYEELTPVPTRKNSIRFISTYAGFDGESQLLHDIYNLIFDNQHNVLDGIERPLGEDFPCYAKERLFVYWDHLPRMKWQTPQYYEDQKSQLRLNNYLRLHENRWVSSESGLFDMDVWDARCDPNHRPPLPDKNIHLFVGVDASKSKDRSAVVTVYREGGLLKLGPKKWWQPTEEEPMDLEETMEAYLLDLKRGYTLISVKYDPWQFHRSAVTLTKKGLPMEEYPQISSNLTEATQNLYDLVKFGNIVLYPCKDMRFEATSSIAKETPRGYRIVKEKSSKTAKRIDQIVALAQAALEGAKSRSLFDVCNN